LRILQIDTGPEMRGGQHQVLLLLNALRDAGHQSILLAREGGPLATSAAAQGFDVHPAEIKEIWRHSRQVDLVHAHDARAHTMAAIAARPKLVVSRRVAFPVKRSVVSAWKYQRASRFLAVSHFVARELEAAGIRRPKIDVVYDAVDTANMASSGANHHWDASYPAVALALDDPLKGKDLVRSAAHSAGIPVLFSEDLLTDLRQASMFVYITQSEGLGSAALLAMEMGVPVIASCVGGLTEIFAHDVSGIFVENEEPTIASAMRRMVAESGLAERLIVAARARIRECFTREHLLHGTLASYGRALGTA
jgi:Glycosyl transferases group 1/Glycosyltransferase Family 4